MPHLAQMGVCKSSNPLHISHIAWFVTTRCGANPPEFGPILALSPGPIFILSFGPLSGSILGLSPSLHLGPFLEPQVSHVKSRPSPRCDSAGIRMLCAATARSLARERPRVEPCTSPRCGPGRGANDALRRAGTVTESAATPPPGCEYFIRICPHGHCNAASDGGSSPKLLHYSSESM